MSKSNIWKAATALALGLAAGGGYAQIQPGKTIGQVEDVMVPIYLDNSPTPAAILRVGRVYRDFQRRGFFRIGILPVVVGEDVSIEIREPDELEQIFTKTSTIIGSFAKSDAVELHRARLLFPGQETPLVEAGRMRLEKQERLRLSSRVTIHTATKRFETTKADFLVAGPQAGQLRWGSTNVYQIRNGHVPQSGKPSSSRIHVAK